MFTVGNKLPDFNLKACVGIEPGKEFANISNASYSNLTQYGNASIAWEKDSGKFLMEINVPVSCTATVYIPAEKANEVTSNNKKIRRSGEITFLRTEEGYAVFKTGSGNYKFESTM